MSAERSSAPRVGHGSASRRIGESWRHLRRIPAMRELRPYLWAVDGDMLDLGQADILYHVGENGPTRVGELADIMRVDRSTVTKAVHRLEAAGLSRRLKDPVDGRGVIIDLTEAGRDRFRRLSRSSGVVFAAILSEFTPRERDDLAVLLGRMVAAADRFIEQIRPGSDD